MPEKLITQFVHYLLCNAPEYFLIQVHQSGYKWNNNNNLCSRIFANENFCQFFFLLFVCAFQWKLYVAQLRFFCVFCNKKSSIQVWKSFILIFNKKKSRKWNFFVCVCVSVQSQSIFVLWNLSWKINNMKKKVLDGKHGRDVWIYRKVCEFYGKI